MHLLDHLARDKLRTTDGNYEQSRKGKTPY